MRYSLLTVATVLAQTQAQAIPMPYGLGSVPIPVGQQNGNIGGVNGQQGYTPSMAAQQSVAKPSSSMMPQRPAYSHGVNHHYYMTPMASSSASHYINMHMSMHASYSASASIPYSVSATPSARAAHGVNHGLHAPHPHEGFAAPAGIPKAGDSVSYNGASTKKGGYHGGNGNGFTQTHGEDSSSDGSPPLMMSPQRGTGSANSATPTTPEYEHAPDNVDGNVAPIPDAAPGGKSIAPIGNPMAPGSNVAPALPQKSHGVDEGNGFCLGQCYESPEKANCAKPYVSL
ncbi:uncharacterized protein N7484_008938 [Penicillium longicatenatum]|uniref:uncharacterized protein n=1 Tax=Penicillium longicatenatum TaxID=1561947 RepID=UPI00254681C7|nr:uncharacterized protein N7484_008938 [Penicillium longicatenatum]KAJ5635625.1 hypothetical protein N7484_008938 [Penicillium longicatenatum]